MQASRYDALVPYRPFEDQNCSIARALEVLGERWTLLVLREVLLGRRRFEEIRRNTGVATNILTRPPGDARRARRARAPRATAVRADAQGDRRQPGARRAACSGATRTPRPTARRACSCTPPAGTTPQPALHCAHCAQEIRPGELRVRPGPGANERQRARAAAARCAGLIRKPARNAARKGYLRDVLRISSALGVLAAVLVAAPAADAQDRYALADGCYGAEVARHRRASPPRPPTAATRRTRRPAGAERFRLQATDLGRYLLYGKDRDFLAHGTPAAGRRRRRPAAPGRRPRPWRADPGRDRAERVRRLARRRRPTARTCSRCPRPASVLAAGDGGALVLADRGAAGDRARFAFEPARRLRGLPGGRDQRHRRADPRRDRRSAR